MKKITSLLLCLLLVCAISVPTLAEGMEEAEQQNVINDAHIFSDTEWDALNHKAEVISHKYRCAVYLIAVEDYWDFGSSPFDAASNIYRTFTLGYGDGRDGVLLLLSMDDRDYEIVTYGYGSEAITDYGKVSVIDEFLDNLAKDDWYGAAEDYLDECARLLAMARSGNVFDAKDDPEALYAGIFFSVIFGLIVAFIVRGVLKRQMRSVAKGAQADSYIPADGANITYRSDTYTHSTETRRKIESSSGGSSSHSGGGFSGRGGKF